MKCNEKNKNWMRKLNEISEIEWDFMLLELLVHQNKSGLQAISEGITLRKEGDEETLWFWNYRARYFILVVSSGSSWKIEVKHTQIVWNSSYHGIHFYTK